MKFDLFVFYYRQGFWNLFDRFNVEIFDEYSFSHGCQQGKDKLDIRPTLCSTRVIGLGIANKLSVLKNNGKFIQTYSFMQL